MQTFFITIMQNTLHELENILKTATYTDNQNQQQKYTDKDGNVIKNQVVELANKLHPDLLRILLKHSTFKKMFFQEIDEITVFDKIAFIRFISQKNFLPDSFTQFKNQIGLGFEYDSQLFLSENKNVVLNFPYKDCILQGGQTKEDAKKNEVFWNITLAPDQINRLLDKKMFTNFKKLYAEPIYENQDDKLIPDTQPKIIGYQNKIEKPTELKENDNFIIKGNNLMALYSLLPRYENKVKLIYIDPPYNTGNDSFLYNDRYNHSTWLLFMKNRLQAAKKLLSSDGSIFINTDDDEAHYLKVLCDEIFGRENFLSNVIWIKKNVVQNDAKYFSDNHDHILIFAKNKEKFNLNLLERTKEMNDRYSNPDNDKNGVWTSVALQAKGGSGYYEIEFPNGVSWKPIQGTHPRLSKESLLKAYYEGKIWFGKEGKNVPRLKKYLSEVSQGLKASTVFYNEEVGSTQMAKEEVKKVLNANIFSTPKPEKLLQRIIQISTNPSDIVLDFYAGSGTTLAVAHKMGRQYIGIEQMDYIEDIPFIRMEKVIAGEQGGVSKAVNWQGGGELVYCELMKYNMHYIGLIQQAQDKNSLAEIREDMIEKAFLNHLFNGQTLEENKQNFDKLSLPDQKLLLFQLLDMNQLYVNFTDAEDSIFKDKLKENDIALTKQFYNLK